VPSRSAAAASLSILRSELDKYGIWDDEEVCLSREPPRHPEADTTRRPTGGCSAFRLFRIHHRSVVANVLDFRVNAVAKLASGSVGGGQKTRALALPARAIGYRSR
jgi:hypothetical protein